MSYSEFPHTHYSSDDNRELIVLYKQLLDAYDGTLKEIEAVSKRLDQYENDMNARIQHIENVTVPNAVNRAVQEAMYAYQQDVNNRFNELTIRLSTVENMYDSLQSELYTEISGVQNDIDALREEMILRDEALQSQINNFNQQVETISQQMEQFKHDVRDEISYFEDNMKLSFNVYLNEMKASQETFENAVRDMLKLQMDDTISRDYEMLMDSKKYTDMKVSALHTLIETLDLTSNMKCIKWVWQYGCNFGGYNAIQWYNETPITCELWNKIHINCVDWYVRGREVFHWFDRRRFMFSPVSGKYVDVQTALLELATALKINGLTAEEYDNLGFTAQEYDVFRETAGDYDWNGRELATDV